MNELSAIGNLLDQPALAPVARVTMKTDNRMITASNLPDLLAHLGFKKKGHVYAKDISGATITVDFNKKTITYPEAQGLVVNERQTCNFSSSENFVVLECVHRLLEKGYKPEHIELEPKWKLGHGASGGRADILIKDNYGKALLIIECKTPGREFDGGWRSTLRDGGQMFSYAQQISETQFLCLYTSEFDKDTLTYTSHVVAHRDNEKYLADNPNFRSFKDATDVKERFGIWRDTYKLDYTTKGVFEDNIQPYHIGKDKYSIADLHAISAIDQQKHYHAFATILRQHNVSGRENAFDKLVNLLLCKLVDEARHPQDLKFYWKGVAYDTHFDLLDRLQQLYQAGMKEFLGEDITYIDQSAVRNAMRFIKQNPDATQKAVWHLFQQQKFFTNNDFSFIDVHNERLFYQNADVLLKILQMWQDIRLTGNHLHNQFLGDLFEGFLDRGVKQSEGQYFTPGPICRFLMMSLPLQTLVANARQPPRAIDYACGAGHFLTELASQLHPLLPENADLADFHRAIYGIEKEYRLSKVAKVSAFMYGQREINICYGDGLVNQHAAFPGIQDNSFDLLVANPPYSVRGFLETLPEEERKTYTLTSTVKDYETANSIETFFIERAKQLLKAGGVAAIILPASILSNGGSTYVKAREILLQHFDIVAIAELGSGTFGETGTNTVTLFLRRKATKPEAAEHYHERVAEWFDADDNQSVYRDAHLMERYAAHIGLPADDYKTLLQGQPNAGVLTHDTFEQYRKAFSASSEVAVLRKQKAFKALSDADQMQMLALRLVAFMQAIERDKLYHFVLASEQSNPVLIIKSPSETKAQKKFLGYGWSGAKGSEGIKLVRDTSGHHVTPLYDETDRRNANKINRCISDNFDGVLGPIPPALGQFVNTATLVDLLDFSRVLFEKQLLLSQRSPALISSKWPTSNLSDLAEIKKGTSITQSKTRPGNVKVVAGGITHAYLHDKPNRAANTITVSASGASAGYVNFWREEIFASDCTTVRGASDADTEFLYHCLKTRQSEIQSLATGAAQPHVYAHDLQNLRIPLIDAATRDQIVAQCEAVDADVGEAQTARADGLKAIDACVDVIYASSVPHQTIETLSLAVQYGLNEAMNEDGVGYSIFRMNEIVRCRMADNGAMKRADISAQEFAKYKLNRGDLLFNRTNSIEHVGKTGLFDLQGDYCFASYLVRVVPDRAKVLPLFLTRMMNSTAFQKEAKGKASKAINQANINATIMRNLKVPVPSMAVQRRFVTAVEKLEHTITKAEAIIASAPAKKSAILALHL